MHFRELGTRHMAAPCSPANQETEFKIYLSQMKLGAATYEKSYQQENNVLPNHPLSKDYHGNN